MQLFTSILPQAIVTIQRINKDVSYTNGLVLNVNKSLKEENETAYRGQSSVIVNYIIVFFHY